MKPRIASPTIVEESPVQEIVFVARLERRHPGAGYSEPAWTGHRILVVRRGRMRLETAGRIYEVGPGTVVWLHGHEVARGNVVEAPWCGYSILFDAPRLPPPEYEARIRSQPEARLFPLCEALWKAWLDSSAAPVVRLCRVQALCLRLLADLTTPGQRASRVGSETALWWLIENELRKDPGRSLDFGTVAGLTRSSLPTITRSCRHAVGLPPSKRLKQLRMSLARSLVWNGRLNFTQIAERVGYARLHEFSRDYRKQFGASPSVDREKFFECHRNQVGGRDESDLRQPSPKAETQRPENLHSDWPRRVAASPVKKILFAARFHLRRLHDPHIEPTFPGHHIQLTKRGRVQIATCGREHEVGPGGVLWFHEDEEFSARLRAGPWVFYNVSFVAPSLPPPGFEARYQARRVRSIVPRFEALHRTWLNLSWPPLERTLRVHAALLEVLAEMTGAAHKGIQVDQEAALWWHVEDASRKNLHRSISLRQMCQLVNRSPKTIARSCKRAVGMSPKQRVKLIRLQMARGLIFMSKLSFKEIATRVGYAREQELSRDYRHKWGVTPTEDRKRFPKTYRRVFRLPYTTEVGRA
jgi:AraC-like DNA-binding protein